MLKGAPMVRLFLIVARLQLASVLSVFSSHTADAKGACGCTSPWHHGWTCFQGFCPGGGGCRDVGQLFPDMESCRRRSVAPAQSAKARTTPPMSKVVSLSDAKRPVPRTKSPTPNEMFFVSMTRLTASPLNTSPISIGFKSIGIHS
jgi:hypothetical protein